MVNPVKVHDVNSLILDNHRYQYRWNCCWTVHYFYLNIRYHSCQSYLNLSARSMTHWRDTWNQRKSACVAVGAESLALWRGGPNIFSRITTMSESWGPESYPIRKVVPFRFPAATEVSHTVNKFMLSVFWDYRRAYCSNTTCKPESIASSADGPKLRWPVVQRGATATSHCLFSDSESGQSCSGKTNYWSNCRYPLHSSIFISLDL